MWNMPAEREFWTTEEVLAWAEQKSAENRAAILKQPGGRRKASHPGLNRRCAVAVVSDLGQNRGSSSLDQAAPSPGSFQECDALQTVIRHGLLAGLFARNVRPRET